MKKMKGLRVWRHSALFFLSENEELQLQRNVTIIITVSERIYSYIY